jgi:hypothetical protein
MESNTQPREKLSHIWSNNFRKRVLRPFSGEKKVFPTNGSGKTGFAMTRNWTHTFYHVPTLTQTGSKT